MLMKVVQNEVSRFYEQHRYELFEIDPKFEGFGKRLFRFLRDHIRKRAVIVTCRVHPGEPQSNYMLNGLLKLLMSPNAFQLRQSFIFRIVPMLNVDGVVHGNYRCSRIGGDLNRKWQNPNRLLYPEIYYTLKMMRMMLTHAKI